MSANDSDKITIPLLQRIGLFAASSPKRLVELSCVTSTWREYATKWSAGVFRLMREVPLHPRVALLAQQQQPAAETAQGIAERRSRRDALLHKQGFAPFSATTDGEKNQLLSFDEMHELVELLPVHLDQMLYVALTRRVSWLVDMIRFSGHLENQSQVSRILDHEGFSPLHRAAVSGGLPGEEGDRVLSVLCDETIDIINTPASPVCALGAVTPLMVVCGAPSTPDHLKFLRFLLSRKGTRVSLQETSTNREYGQWSALHHAAATNNVEAAKLLLEAGADATLRNKDGETALELAKKRPQCAKFAKFLEEAVGHDDK